MIVFKKTSDIRSWLRLQEGKTGFVPTMGALHKGHLSLIGACRDRGLIPVCSIFINPTQFNDPSDFERYPRQTEADIALLIEAGCEVLFLPDASEIYPGGAGSVPAWDFGYLETVLEGSQRPGHFRGVGQVVGRLLEIVQPDVLFLGQKDYQQCLVVGSLIRQMALPKAVTLEIAPTVREDDGLACSSRNALLDPQARAVAPAIYQCLVSIQAKQSEGSFDVVKKECEALLRDRGFEPEYVALADARDLTLLDAFDPSRPMVALIAARLGKVRLIDNLII